MKIFNADCYKPTYINRVVILNNYVNFSTFRFSFVVFEVSCNLKQNKRIVMYKAFNHSLLHYWLIGNECSEHS